MGTNCAPLIADLSLFFHERYYMWGFSDNNQAYVIGGLNVWKKAQIRN